MDGNQKHQVRIIFDGVVAVGPPHPLDPGAPKEQDGPLYGVMVHSVRRRSDRSRRKGNQEFIPMHVPTIFTTLSPSNDSRPPDQVFQLSKDHPRWYMWHPVRERIEFRIDGDSTPRKLTYDDPRTLEFTDSGGLPGVPFSVRSIGDVPDGRKVWPERSYLREGTLAEHPPQEVAAQVLVPWGNVVGGGLMKKSGGVDVKFFPPKRPHTVKNVVPNVVVFVEAGKLELVTYSLDDGEQLDSIRFDVTGDAELWVSNGDPTDLAVDMNNVGERVARDNVARAQEAFERELAKRLENARERTADALRKSVLELFSSGPGRIFPADVIDPRFDRRLEVDLDFELYYLLEEPDPDGDRDGLAIPMTPDGAQFEMPNCYNKLLQTR
ncbi:MAG TPA: hypothetical protein VF698_06410, partial [Thermoanaerobaculia bacterium]